MLDKNYRVHVTPEQSRQIQELLFGIGYVWWCCDGSRLTKVKNTLKKYLFIEADKTITSSDNSYSRIGGFTEIPATIENYERLQATFPDIEFEQPPKPLVENDLCIAMLKGKHTNIMCQVDSDKTNIRIITLYTGDFFYDRSGNRYSQVIPVDTTGEPLTESVLDE